MENKEIKKDNNSLSMFEELSNINLNDKIKKKVGLSYLSWAYALSEIKKYDPDCSTQIYTQHKTYEITSSETIDGKTITTKETYEKDIPYFDDGKTTYVKVGVTIKGKEEIEVYPIIDIRNNSVRLSSVTMVDVNKAIQRAFVKACARHGLGLYIYAGEDLPEADKAAAEAEKNAPVKLSNGNTLAELQADVTALATKLFTTSQADETKRYIGVEMFPGKRISQTTEEDIEKLIAARKYLVELESKI